MTTSELQSLQDLRTAPSEEQNDWEDDDNDRMQDIVAGREEMEISHGGGEFNALLDEMAQDWEAGKAKKGR